MLELISLLCVGVCKLTVTGLDSDEDVPYSFIKVSYVEGIRI